MDFLLQLLQQHNTRLGGKTRNGLGSFKIQKCLRHRFNLKNKQEFQQFSRLPSDISQPLPDGIFEEVALSTLEKEIMTNQDIVTVTMKVRPRGFWLIGGGMPTEDDEKLEGDRYPDMMPYREIRVAWNNNKADINTTHPTLIFPATALKGSLHHRVRFYAFIESEKFAKEVDSSFVEQLKDDDLPEEYVEELFGTVRKKSEEEKEKEKDRKNNRK